MVRTCKQPKGINSYTTKARSLLRNLDCVTYQRISPGDRQVVEEEIKLGGKLKRLDFWGKALTAASVAMVIVTLAVTLFRVMANG